ncbi:MAG: hypothetical protein M3Y58_21180 [Chloroflexota bacterium]|nr:hypothetical protein [Chloroflexota bacterium]
MNRAPSRALPPFFRAFATDELLHAIVVLLIAAFVGLVILDRVVTRLAPDGRPAAGIATPVAHVFPAFQGTPSRVQTNGKPLTVTLRGTGTRIEAGYTPTRYVFLADPPNGPPLTLCDTNTPTCALPLDGSRQQAGTWIVTLRVYDNTGGSAETRTRLRVT